MKKGHVLFRTRRKLSLPGNVSKQVVISVLCDRLNVAVPTSWDRRYKLMKQWVDDAGSVTPSMPKRPKRPKPQKLRRALDKAQSDAFLLSYEWRSLRMFVIKKRGARCECCGSTPRDGIRINVDHIKPRKTHPELSLAESNLQVLCEVCNHGKGNWDDTDWRVSETVN